jgi:Ca2+-binding EF-hand superfamily protein
MIRFGAALLGALMALGGMVRAEGDPLVEAMDKDPTKFVERVIDLIAGFGDDTGLLPEGIEAHIALERAGARASALRRFMALDLDANGVVARAELAVGQHAATASARGRMERQFAAADLDGDGSIDAGELARAGQAAAMRAMGEEEAELLRALMRLDADGDGALTVEEVETAVAQMDV